MLKEVTKTKKGKTIVLIVERKAYTAPQIEQEIMQDDGEMVYILKNGNTQLKNSYDAMWGQPKGTILPKGTKGTSIDPRSNYY